MFPSRFFHFIDRLEKKITGAFSVLVIEDFVRFPGTNFSGQRSMNFLLELIYIFLCHSSTTKEGIILEIVQFFSC